MKPGELYGYHSGAPNEASYTAGLAELLRAAEGHFTALGLGALRTESRVRSPRREPRATDNLIAAYERALVEEAGRHPGLVALDADLVKDCGLVSFAKQYPERFVECGIAEQDMVSMACGMAPGRGNLAESYSTFQFGITKGHIAGDAIAGFMPSACERLHWRLATTNRKPL